MAETPMQRVEYLLGRVKEEEARIKGARDLRDRIDRSEPAVRKVTAEPVRNGWRFWARTKRHAPYVDVVFENEFVLTDDEIEAFQHFLDRYASERDAAKKRYEDQILHPKEDR